MKLKISKEARKQIIQSNQEVDRFLRVKSTRFIRVHRKKKCKFGRWTFINDSKYLLLFCAFGSKRPKNIPKLIFRKIGPYKIGFEPKDLNLILRKKIVAKRIYSKSKKRAMDVLTLE